jgi:DNA-binding NarL/FixJ family response regulator
MLLGAEPDMAVVGEACDGQEVLAQATTLEPDIILLDLTMSGQDGLDVLPQLKAISQARILVLTMHEDQAYLRQALQMGASGYVLKKAADTELLLAIRAVARGEIYVHSALTKSLLEDVLPQSPDAVDSDSQHWETLSDREQQVIKGIVLGYTSEEIAEQYHLSVKTVYTYRSRAMTKLNLDNRAQLVDLALRLGLLNENTSDL